MVQLPSVLIENSHPPLESGTELQSQHLLREDPMELSRGRISHLISSHLSFLYPLFHFMEGDRKKRSGVGGGALLNKVV